MSRKKFIELQGATCKNWRWSWAFINEAEKTVIFGAWDTHTENGKSLILSEIWENNTPTGKKQPGYKEAREYMRLVEDEGYILKIYYMINAHKKDVVPAKMKSFERNLIEKSLSTEKHSDGWLEWYAAD